MPGFTVNGRPASADQLQALQGAGVAAGLASRRVRSIRRIPEVTQPGDYVCTGTADHTVISQAIADCNADGGGIVSIGEGQYTVTGPIVFPTGAANVTLEGMGVKTRIRLANGTVQNIIEGASVSKIVIRNMRLDGNQANNSDPGNSNDSKQNNIALWNVAGLEITGVWSHDAIFHGIFVRDEIGGNADINIHHNFLYDNGYRACHLHGNDTISVRNVSVCNNICWGNAKQSAAATLGNGGIFAAYQNARAIDISHNIVHDDPGVGIQVSGTFSSGTVTADTIIVSHNIVFKTRGMGISNGARKLTIDGNIVADSTDTGLVIDCFESGKVQQEILVRGNQITGGTARGVQIGRSTAHSASEITLDGNLIAGNVGSGIYVPNTGSVQNLLTRGNVIKDNGSWGVEVIGGSFTMRGWLINENIILRNSAGAVSLTSCDDMVVRGNLVIDNVPSGGGSNNTILLVGCARPDVSDNRIYMKDRTQTGGGGAISLNNTCSDGDVSRNTCDRQINIKGTNIRVRNNRGSGDIYIDTAASGCAVEDNDNTASPYLTDVGTNTRIRRRVAPPATATSAGRKGDEAFDAAGNAYRCTATNTWVRAAYATF